MASGALVMCPGGVNLARVLEWVPGSPKKSLTASQSDREAGKAKKHARRTRYCPKWQFGIFTIFRVTVRTVVGGWKFFYGQIPPRSYQQGFNIWFLGRFRKIKSKSISCQLKSELRSHADGSQLGVQLDGLWGPGEARCGWVNIFLSKSRPAFS